MIYKKDLRFFNQASKEANKSDYANFKIGCVAVSKGKIIATGFNSTKSHPVQMKYDNYRDLRAGEVPPHTLHAEIDCLNKIKSENVDMSKLKLYIYRKRFDTPAGLARPCPACMQRIKDLGIKDIYYTTNTGYAAEHIEF